MRAWSDLGGQDAGMVVNLPGVNEQPLRHLGNLLVKAGHQRVHRLFRRHPISLRLITILFMYDFPAKRQGVCASKVHIKAAKSANLVGFARSKSNQVNNGHGAQHLYHLPASRDQYLPQPNRRRK